MEGARISEKGESRGMGESVSAYQRRIRERDEARRKLKRLQRAIWDVQQKARAGMMLGRVVSPFSDLEGDEEGPRLNEEQLRESILSVKVF